MRIPTSLLQGMLCAAFLFCAGTTRAQYSVGLYKGDKLINTFSAGSPVTNSSRTSVAPLTGGQSTPLASAAPVISADKQQRNQVFADFAMLGIQIQDVARQMRIQQVNFPHDQQSNQLSLLLQKLTDKQSQVDAAFDSIANDLIALKLPEEVLQKHFSVVATNEAAFVTLTNAIRELLNANPATTRKAIDAIDCFKFREEPDLSRRSPTRQLMTIIPAPCLSIAEADARLSKERKSSAVATASPSFRANFDLTPAPTTNDLAETPDIQLTPAIRAKAVSLNNNPLAIYEYVRNNIKYQPYCGSRKGADFTLQQLAGNDMDQASLLIALLRAAGIPCRYVQGTVEMTPAQAASWLGVDDPGTAGSILTTIGLGGVNIVSGTNVTAVRCNRTWVEAFIPYSNYRGVPNDQNGKTWIPLDPAFKQTTILQGQNILSAMSYDNNAFLANYVSTYNSNSPIQMLTTNIQLFLNTNQPGKHVADIERTVVTQPLSLGLVPSSLPISQLTRSSGFPSLNDTNRFKVRFSLYNGGTSLIDFTTNLCQLLGHMVIIDYLGATTNDQAIINTNGGIFQTPPYLVNVKPVFRIDGVAVATATNAIGMGYTHNSDMYFLQPGGAPNSQPAIYNTIIAGNCQAIGLDSFLDIPNMFISSTNAVQNSLLMNLLQSTASDYLSRVDRGEEEVDRLLRTIHTVDVSEVIAESSVAVTYSLGGVPQTFTWTGLTVDADRRITGPFGANGDNSKSYTFMTLSGYDGSFQENKVFENDFKQPAVSTMRILQWSRDQGISTCYITNSISSACPGFSHSSSVLNAINNALAAGHVVMIPQQDITVSNWSGTGYIDLTPSTGAAAYIISGGINGEITAAGGSTIATWSEPLSCPLTACTVNNPPNGQVFCADSTPLSIDSTLTITCNSGSSTQPWDIDTGFTMGSLAAQYGGGDYTVTISASGNVTCTSTFTIIKINTQTVATTPANRARTKIGIGEQVVCSITPPVSVNWSVTGGGTVPPSAGSSTTFTASMSPSTSTVHAMTASGLDCTITFMVVAPNGMTSVLDHDGSLGSAGNNNIGAHSYFDCYVLPNDVSFYNVQFRENIPGESFTWPDGTAGSRPAAIVNWSVSFDNKTTDDVNSALDPKMRIFTGGSYVNFNYSVRVPEEYLNASGTWVSWLPGEDHPRYYRGSDLKAHVELDASNTAVGGWMGPWQ